MGVENLRAHCRHRCCFGGLRFQLPASPQQSERGVADLRDGALRAQFCLSHPPAPQVLPWPEAVRYTRRLTIVWCVFFVFNGLVAFWTAVAQPDEIWALYNGFIAYLLIGSLIVGEMVFRKIRLNR